MWQVLTDANLIAEEYKRLKSDGRVVTNYPMIGTEIEDSLKMTQVLWTAGDNSVSVLVKQDDLCRLYFITNKPTEYVMPEYETQLPVITEIYEKTGKERCSEVTAALLQNGFEAAKKYNRYEIKLHASELQQVSAQPKNEGADALSAKSEVTFSEDKTIEAYEQIYDCFDPIGAQLPPRSRLQAYMDETDIVIASLSDELCAAAIYRIKSGIATEEYVYTPVDMRCRGYSKQVERRLIEIVSARPDVRRLNAWVEEKNISSLRLHDEFGYKKTADYKLTLVARPSAD